jgi:hypothetical protein
MPAVKAAFSGKVVKVTPGKWKDPDGHDQSFKLVCFAVTHVTKGTVPSNQCVYTGAWDGDCGYPFEVGRSYQVEARNRATWFPGKGLSVITCDAPRMLETKQ